MTINSSSDRCNLTYGHYTNQPMCMCELQINLNVAKIPQLINSLNRKKPTFNQKSFSNTI